MTRVLQVVLSLNPGGTERLVVELARRLHGEMPTMVCCLDTPGAWASQLEAQGIAVRALGRQPGFHPSLGRALAAVAREHRATVMHAHHYSPFVYACLAKAWRPQTSVVFTEHGRLSDTPPSVKRRFANRLLARVPRGVFAVSNELRGHIIGEGFASPHVGVIYNGIDIGPLPNATDRDDVRRTLGVDEGTFVVATIARLDPVKDLATLVRATAVVAAERAVRVVIIGDGPERGALETLVDGLGVRPHVTFLGHRDDARRWLAGSDAYVNCSVSEGVSLTILEAMAACLPVVATSVGGTPEVVDATCGVLVPARDAERLAEALKELARRQAPRGEMGLAARQRVETRFTLDRMVHEYADVYARRRRT